MSISPITRLHGFHIDLIDNQSLDWRLLYIKMQSVAGDNERKLLGRDGSSRVCIR